MSTTVCWCESQRIERHCHVHGWLALLFLLFVLGFPGNGICANAEETVADVVVYGGTSGGVVAAVQVARLGKSVVLIEPGRHLGGLSSGGLGATDIGNKSAIGGMAREFYHRVWKYYLRPEAWKYGTRDEYLALNKGRADWNKDETWWLFEPHAAEEVFRAMIAESRVPVVYGERLLGTGGVEKRDSRVISIKMESGRKFSAKVFVDATYEGDLMAQAGIAYATGREANARHGETINGVQPHREHERYYYYHQFSKPVSAFLKPGDSASGLLPGVGANEVGVEGSGDHRVQAYCFRTCLTDQLENKAPISKPADYDPLRYELLLRYYEAGFDKIPVDPLARMGTNGLSPRVFLPNRKTDNNNIYAVSVDYTGMNYGYPDGDYPAREKIIRDHASYQQGLYWTLAHNPRVPEKLRQEMMRWGLAKDEFTDNDHWPHQLYVREARRMVSDYVMTEHNCWRKQMAGDSVGLAAYGMDSHNVQRYADAQGNVRNEGNVQTEGNEVLQPYPVSYRSIVPRAGECTNVLVPVCASASHVAYGSIRMEPVFMILGQSAGVAAVEALERATTVQQVSYDRLRDRLSQAGQILAWPPPK
ncbi:MAG: FAD-dependent oxidoreductase [Verrucomicrobia bacterium]|nr:FAD-dependent oxidoreductase [Verrucomicrobiota bacterium]